MQITKPYRRSEVHSHWNSKANGKSTIKLDVHESQDVQRVARLSLDLDEVFGRDTGFRPMRGVVVAHRLRAMGIPDRPIALGSPWQNGFAERLIRSIRRECVDHIVVLGEAHLRRILGEYAAYYNESRTHRSLDKDAPVSRPVQRIGSIRTHALLGGLHHRYVRV